MWVEAILIIKRRCQGVGGEVQHLCYTALGGVDMANSGNNVLAGEGADVGLLSVVERWAC